MKEQDDKQSLKILSRRAVISSFGGGVINPFVNIYAAQMGASPIEMGWIRAVNTVSANIAQIPWGLLIDKLKRRVPFIFLGGLLHGVLFLPLIFISSVSEFLIMIALSAIFTAMISPSLNSLIGDLCGEGERGKVFAQLNAMASVGSVPATIVSGYILYKMEGSLKEVYRIPVILGFLFSLIAAIMTLKIRERPLKEAVFTFKGWAEALRMNIYFRRLCYVSSVQGFFMAMAWPLFTLTIVDVIKADMFQIALVHVISSITAIMVRRFTGRLADRAGRKPLIVVGRGGLFLVPLVYALASSVYEIMLVEFAVGIMMASSDVALSAYLLDVSPKGLRGSYIGLYHALSGIFSFMGSIVAGYLMNYLIISGFGFQESMRLVYAISIAGRLTGGLLYISLKEPHKYPAKFSEEMERILKEEVERVKEEIETAEERAERFKRVEDEDLEWFEKISSSKP